MDEKRNGDAMNNDKSIRTLIALDGKFKSMGIDNPNQNLQSCNNVKEGGGIEIGRDSTGDVSFSSYLIRTEELFARRSSSERNPGEGAFPIVNCRCVDNKKGQSMGIEYQRRVSKSKLKAGNSSPREGSTMNFKAKTALIDGNEPYLQRSVRLDTQASFGPRVLAGRNAKHGELDVFDAESYFSNTLDEEKSSPRLVVSNSRKGQNARQGNKCKRPHITKGLNSDNNVISDGGVSISRQQSSEASSMGSKAVQSESQASWNSQSGMISNGVTSLLSGTPFNQRSPTGPKNGTPKWKIGCKCPCTSKKSVATNDSLLYQAASSSVQSSHVSSPLSSNNCSSIQKSYSLDKTKGLSSNKDRDFANKFLSIQKDDQSLHANPKMGKSLIEIRPEEEVGTSGKNQGEGFSFPILGSSSMSSFVFSIPKEKPRLSLQVLESSCCSSRDFQKQQSSHTQRRPRMYSVDSKAETSSSTETRSSFSFPRISFCSQDGFDDKDLPFTKSSSAYNYHAMKLDNAHTAEDDRSDSSSDLFEIENLSTGIVPCTQYNMRTSSGRIQLKDCNPSTSRPEIVGLPANIPLQDSEMDSEAAGQHSYISSRAKQEEKYNVEIGRRSEGYISRSIVRDSGRDFAKPTRNSTFLRSYRNNRAVYIASAPVSPIRGAHEDLNFEQRVYFKKR